MCLQQPLLDLDLGMDTLDLLAICAHDAARTGEGQGIIPSMV